MIPRVVISRNGPPRPALAAPAVFQVEVIEIEGMAPIWVGSSSEVGEVGTSAYLPVLSRPASALGSQSARIYERRILAPARASEVSGVEALSGFPSAGAGEVSGVGSSVGCSVVVPAAPFCVSVAFSAFAGTIHTDPIGNPCLLHRLGLATRRVQSRIWETAGASFFRQVVPSAIPLPRALSSVHAVLVVAFLAF